MIETTAGFPELLFICGIVALILTTALTKVVYHHDIAVSFLTPDGAEMTQFCILSFEKEIPWTVLRDAAGSFLSKVEAPYSSGTEVIIGSNSVALKRVFHPFWKDSSSIIQKMVDTNEV